MFTIEATTGRLLYNGSPVTPKLNGQAFQPPFEIAPSGPAVSLNSDGELVVSNTATGVTYTVAELVYSLGCNAEFVFRQFSFDGAGVTEQTCIPITELNASVDSLVGQEGEALTVELTVVGGGTATNSLPAVTVPSGWTLSGSYPTYQASGPAPASDQALSFNASNQCTSVSESVAFEICEPIVLIETIEECHECNPAQMTQTAQEVLDGMVANGGAHESTVERINGNTGGRFFRSVVATGSNPSQLPAGYGVDVHNAAWEYISLRPWNVGYEKAGTSGNGNMGLMSGPGRIMAYSVSQGRWSVIGMWNSMSGGGFSDRATNPFNDLTDASQYNATDEAVGACRVQKWDENDLGNADGGLMAHQWHSDFAFDPDDTCGIWVQQKARIACIDPALPLGPGGFQFGVGADPYTVNGYGNNAGASAPDDLGYPAGVGLARLIDLTTDWRIANMVTVEGAGEIADLIGGDVGGCQTMTQQAFLDSLAAQPELLTW